MIKIDDKEIKNKIIDYCLKRGFDISKLDQLTLQRGWPYLFLVIPAEKECCKINDREEYKPKVIFVVEVKQDGELAVFEQPENTTAFFN